MGLLLIALGVIMLVSQILEVSLIEYIIKWWPIVLISIGLEILIYVFLSKQEDTKVKYDVFSIIIISILVIVSVGVYVVTGLIASGDGVFIVDSVFSSYNNESKFTKNFEVENKFGDIENDFGLEVKEDVNSSSMKGSLLDDKIKFNLDSGNGDIKVEKVE